MSRWHFIRRLIPLLAVFLLLFTGCSAFEAGPLNPKGSVGQDQLWLIMLSLVIMIGVLIVVFALFFYVLVRYRKRRGQTGIPKQVEGNHKLELIWTIVPLLLLFVLAVPTVAKTFELAEKFDDASGAIEVKVTGHQFWWEFEYKDHGIITAQELVIPVGKRVQYELVTTDVNHSFWIPALGGKQDNVAGVTNHLYLDAEEAGVYRGRCAELCGAGHALMNFNVKAVSQAEFDQWIADMQAPAPAAEEIPQELQAGHEVFASKCIQCHAIDSSAAGAFPNLDGFANRDYVAGFLENNERNLRDWLKDPQAVKPGNKMPNMGLSDQELDDLLVYLNSLK
jgi:cytochrome c oxidase subunit 2